jgi:outer membrane lipoprotein-sorting protein
MIGLSFSSLDKFPFHQTMQYKPFHSLPTRAAAVLLALGAITWPCQVSGQTPPGAPQNPVGQTAAPGANTLPAGPGAPTTEAPAQPPTEAEKLIDQAIKKVAGYSSVAADMTQNVDMLKQKFAVKGRYLKGPSSRLYLKLTVTGLPDSSGTLLQICDGETLWDYQQILESQTYRKMSIKPVLERLNSPDIDAKTRDLFMSQIGFSGPEALLVGLRKSIRFDQKEEGELDGKAVWILRGTWLNRTGFVGPDQRPLPAMGPLPAYVPSLATLYLGKDDGWPYKLILVGKMSSILQEPRRGPDGRLVAARSSVEKIDPSKIELVYSNVQINPKLKPEEFAFQAGPNANVEDTTEIILKGLDQAIQYQAMQKRTEAARQEGPLLDQPIEIPKPTTEPTPK